MRVTRSKRIDLEVVIKLGVDIRLESRPFKFMLFIGQEISDRFAANNFWGTMTKRLTVRPFMNIKRPGIRKKISN